MTVYTIFGLVGAVAFLLTLIKYFTARPSNILIAYLQYFVGSLFIFSGFVKAVDPLGTGYKMHEYFEAFAGEGLRPFWEWIAQFSTFFSIVMIALELFIGFMLLIGWMPRFTTTVIWWLTLFFTFLTGYTYLSGYSIDLNFILLAFGTMAMLSLIAVPADSRKRQKNALISTIFIAVLLVKFGQIIKVNEFVETKMKVTDCGCFGDFIKLKPWETFYKDLVLDAMILLLVLGAKHVRPVFNDTARTGLAFVSGVASVVFCLYNVYMDEPMIDFRPYKPGNDIVDLRKEKVPAKIEMLFVYKNKKTGELKEYTMNELTGLNYDEIEFVERKDKVLDPGIPAKITNLRIEDEEGQDITDTLLSDDNYSLMVVSHNLNKTHADAFKELNEIAKGCDKIGVKFYAVTVNDGKVEDFRHQNNTAYPFYHADETPLKTIIRSNPGLVLFKHGVVVAKWHHRHLPTYEQLNKEYFKK